MKYDFNQAYDITHSRFVPVPVDVQARIEAQMGEVPETKEIHDAMRSALKQIEAHKSSASPVPCEETIHEFGPVSEWRRLLNAVEDALRDKRASHLSTSLQLPKGEPRAFLVTEDAVGSIRAVISIIWDEKDWDAAHVAVSFTAIMTHQFAA